MNITKALEVAEEYRAEGRKLLALADDIEAAARKAQNGAGAEPARNVERTKPNGTDKSAQPISYLTAGLDVLREAGRAMHVNEMLPKISEKMGKVVTRANVEGSLVRAFKQGKIGRPRPSTYAPLGH